MIGSHLSLADDVHGIGSHLSLADDVHGIGSSLVELPSCSILQKITPSQVRSKQYSITLTLQQGLFQIIIMIISSLKMKVGPTEMKMSEEV